MTESLPRARQRMNRPPHSTRQRGISLIVAMVVLLLITSMSVSVMRGAMNSDVVVNNARVQTLAEQAAMMGLRFCESQLNASAAQLPEANVNGTSAWSVAANWSGQNNQLRTVPETWMVSNSSSFTTGRLPDCLMEKMLMGTDVYTVTARGFSPDYTADSNGRTVSGAVVWMQSTVRMQR